MMTETQLLKEATEALRKRDFDTLLDLQRTVDAFLMCRREKDVLLDLLNEMADAVFLLDDADDEDDWSDAALRAAERRQGLY